MQWWKKSVVYQIYPMSFKDSNNDGMGDLGGIIEKIDYLKELGINVIWLTPIYNSPLDDNGYDISDYYSIHKQFGTMEQFEELLEKAHKNEIKIIMDLVVNHTSDEHEWFKNARENKNSKYRDYYIWSDTIKTEQQSIFSGSVWQYDDAAEQYYYHLFSKRQPDLNWDNENMRKDVYKIINWWLDKGIDGFRLDVIDLIGKVPNECLMTSDKAHIYLKEMHENCFKGRDILTVGETPYATTETAPLFSREDRNELSMIFGFEHIGLDEVEGNGKWDLKSLDVNKLKNVLSKWQNALHNDGWGSLFWSNHDQPRIVSRFGNDKEYRVESAKMLATTLHGMQGTPYIYQGEEIGMTNVKFPLEKYKDVETLNMVDEKLDLGWSMEKIMKGIYAKGRDNARTPMQWSDLANAGFSEANPWIEVNPNYKDINVNIDLSSKYSIFNHYKKLINFRKKYDVIVNGDFELILKDDNRIFSYVRRIKNEKIFVISNFTENKLSIEIPVFDEFKNSKLLISNYTDDKLSKILSLNPYESRMYYINKFN